MKKSARDWNERIRRSTTRRRVTRRACVRRANVGELGGNFGKRTGGHSAAGNDVALAAGMSFGMIWFMHKFSIFVFALVFSLNTFARENTLLDSDWKFKLGDPQNCPDRR